MKSRKMIATLLSVVMLMWNMPFIVLADGDEGGNDPAPAAGEETPGNDEGGEPAGDPADPVGDPEGDPADPEGDPADPPEDPAGDPVDDPRGDTVVTTIGSAEDWDAFAEAVANGNVSGSYELTANITVTTPVGTSEYPFGGEFDGKGYTITFNATDSENQGLAPFRYIADATITNVKAAGTVIGNYHAAGLVGFAWSGVNTITDCTVSSEIASAPDNGYIGGIVGHAKSSTLNMSGCVFTGILDGRASVEGGLIGWMDDATINISDCFFVGTRTGSGAFHPVAFKSGGCNVTYSVTDCYSTVDYNGLNGNSKIADGLVKVVTTTPAQDKFYSTFTYDGTDYYYEGKLSVEVDPAYIYSGTPITVTPVVKVDGNTIASENYTVSITDGSGNPVADIIESGTYTLTVTGIGSKGYTGSKSTTFKVTTPLEGEGTEYDPYLISSDEDWVKFADLIAAGIGNDAYYRLTRDIDVDVCVGTEEHPFEGSFDGNGCQIYSWISDQTAGTAPFRYIRGAELFSIGVCGTVQGGIHAAGLVGFNMGGSSSIYFCSVFASITGSTHAGGIIGHNKSASVSMEDCRFYGNIDASEKAGGIVGWMDAGSSITMNKCKFEGSYDSSANPQFHPIALRSNNAPVTTDLTEVYYTVDPTTTSGGYVLGSNIGTRVYSDAPGEGTGIYRLVETFDGDYYIIFGTISGIPEYIYSDEGTAIVPVVKDASGNALTEDTDYVISITRDGEPVENVDQPGVYTVSATGIGEYSGSSSTELTVYPTVTYQDYNASTGKFSTQDAPPDLKEITSSMTRWNSGWYVVTGNVTISSRVFVNGSVRIILADGARLTANYGITVNPGRSITIYGQEEGTGQLVCYARDSGDAALGACCNNDSPSSQSDESNNFASFGDITINGGVVTADATACYYAAGAGIGGGEWQAGFGGERVGHVTINGGKVTARGKSGAGIGGGYGDRVNSNVITIRGGQVDASSRGAAGMGRNSTINITWDSPDSGMTVKSKSYEGTTNLLRTFQSGEDIYYPGRVSDTSALNNKTLVPYEMYTLTYKSGEGSGNDVSDLLAPQKITLENGLLFTAPEGKMFAGWQADDAEQTVYQSGATITLDNDITLTAIWDDPVIPYVDENGNDMDPRLCSIIYPDTFTLNADDSTWYAVTESLTVDQRIEVNGDVNLILCDGVTFSAPKGISVTEGNCLKIWCQSGATGALVIDDVEADYSGIGGYRDASGVQAVDYGCGTIIIKGGNITITVDSDGAGIGTGRHANNNSDPGSGDIYIYNGVVDVTSTAYGAAIGGGMNTIGADVHIYGGTVNAASTSRAAAIGGGSYGDGGNITITGGTVTASNSDSMGGSCIGGGYGAAGGNILISGGTVVASGSTGIGRGKNSNGADGIIEITWSGNTELRITSSRYDAKKITLTNNFVDTDGDKYPAGGYTTKTGQLEGKTLISDRTPSFAGYSLLITGEVGLNFFMDLSMLTAEERASGYMTFEITGSGSSYINTRDDFDAEFTTTDEAGNIYHGFTCYTTSIQMEDTITATFHYGDGQTISKEYSVSDYIEYIVGHPSQYDQKTINLAKALANYGHYAQVMLAEVRGWSLGDDYSPIETYYSDELDHDLVEYLIDGYGARKIDTDSHISQVSISVAMASKLRINILLTMESDDYGIYGVTGADGFRKLSDGRYLITIDGLTALSLDNEYSLKIVTSSNNSYAGLMELSCSGLSYVKALLNTNITSYQDAACALFYFYAAAKAYVS